MAITSQIVERFRLLFSGGDHAHGVWNPETGDMKTLKKPAEIEEYQNHLEGRMGLGICPINTEGAIKFAAIDVDVDNIDHALLKRKVVERRMPLNVCRSKSGGAHLYLFVKEKMRATSAITVLRKWASVLGFPKAEIFPKQDKVSKSGNIGNWINLPYFDGDKTVRFCVSSEGSALGLEQFLDNVEYWNGKDQSDDTVKPDLIQIGQMPPCLAVLTRDGLASGQRNQGMFNFAVFYRKASPNGWEDLLVEHNQKYVNPPLPNRELQSIIRSASDRKYQYTCDQEPICSLCDRKTCLTLPFGISNEPWKDQVAYADLLVSHCRKIMTDPPRYIVEVNGHDVEFSSDQFFNFANFQRRVLERLNILGVPQKKEYWDKKIIELMEKITEIEAPKDASESGMISDLIQSFLALHERSLIQDPEKGPVSNREDLLRGVPIVYQDAIAFRVIDLQKYLHSQRTERWPNQQLYQLLYNEGCKSASLRINGKTVTVWLYPLDKVNRQTEDFTPPSLINPEHDL